MIYAASRRAMLALVFTIGCGDHCERLCRETSVRVAACMDEGTRWVDLGAQNRADYADQCLDDWDRTGAQLTTSDLGEAVETCGDARDTLDALSCDEVRVLLTTR
jgi:hypothetical protein